MGFNSKYTGAQIEELLYKIPTTYNIWHTGNLSKLSQLENDLKFITDSALGDYLLKITSSNKLDYSFIKGMPTTLSGYGITDAYTKSQVDSALGGYLPLSGGTITGNLTVGNSSGVLGIKHTSSNSLAYLIYQGGTNWRVTDNGWANSYNIIHSGNIGNQSVASAAKLTTARTIWGQSFDGAGNVTGNLYLGSNILYGGNNYNILDISSGISLNIGYGIRSVGSTVYWAKSHAFYVGDSHALTINSSGNIGIGTTSPKYKLDVNGTMYGDLKMKTPRTIWGQSFDGTGNVSGAMNVDGSIKNNVYQYIYNNTDRTDRLCLAWSNNTACIYSIKEDGSMYNNLRIGATTTNGTRLLFLDYASGNWGVGMSTPQYKFDVNGDIHSNSSITQDSDINLKDISKDVLLSLDDISEAPLFEFTYKNDENKRIHVGTSAQYWVEKNNWFCKKQDNGYYDMEIQNLALASAISIAKEFKKYKEETESTINSMKNEIKELKQIILNMSK